MNPSEKKDRNPAPRKRKHTARQKVKQHLRDKNHVITEEDLRDVVIGPEAVDMDAQREGHPEETIEGANEKMNEEVPENKKTTPWDLVNESP